ncbi:MJ0042-type zinc finger domain-containing protein [Moraxella atlantae]|uniref:MJ0042-type zinc finger domain-containing protein n=1 Tax=Faucicola atlantae TaxID=34059 RepID=UPI003751AC8D
MPTAEFDCPYCHQHFAIKKSLIARKKGYVRCAHCKHHFSSNQSDKQTLIFDDNVGLDDDATASASQPTPATTSHIAGDFEILDNLAVSVHDTSPVFAKEI